MQADLQPPPPDADLKARNVPGSTAADATRNHMLDVIGRFVRAFTYADMPWLEAQEAGLLWAPLRKPHENAADPHWRARGSYAEIAHPEHGRSFTYPVSRWMSTATAWRVGRRAPLLGEDTEAVLAEPPRAPRLPAAPRATIAAPARSALGKPFPLQGVRIFDFSWFLASAGGTRFLAALGAEVIKVEWKDNPDTRLAAMAPVGGRSAREAATDVLPGVKDPDMGGQFNNKNPGKRGISLNIRHPKGLAIARRLIAQSDIVAEGFSPGVLERLGLGYDALRAIRPDIIYVQQSGMGAHGTYGRMRTVGPVAAAFAGQSEMSGLPEPAMPAGWGYSFLDWMGAYSFALAILGALYHRERTGEGQWIDASQCESGLYLGAVPVLDFSANGRVWRRSGNRSPYAPAAPHGAYPCAGEDRWIAIACETEAQFAALARAAGHPEWAADPRFATLPARIAHQDALDSAVALLDPHPGSLRLHEDFASRPGSRRRVPDGGGPVRERSATARARLAHGGDGYEDRALAGLCGAGETLRHARPCRRHDRPRRALLRGGYRLGAHHLAGHERGGGGDVGGRRGDLTGAGIPPGRSYSAWAHRPPGHARGHDQGTRRDCPSVVSQSKIASGKFRAAHNPAREQRSYPTSGNTIQVSTMPQGSARIDRPATKSDRQISGADPIEAHSR